MDVGSGGSWISQVGSCLVLSFGQDWNGIASERRGGLGGSAEGYDESHRRQTAEFPALATGKEGSCTLHFEGS
jgi:hypothetical protein